MPQKQYELPALETASPQEPDSQTRLKKLYPAQLQKMLGDGYEVFNFGVSAKTVIRNCSNSYMATPMYPKALESNS